MKKLSLAEWIGVAAGVTFVAYMFFGGALKSIFINKVAQTAAIDNSTNPVTNQVQTQDEVVGSGAEIKPGMLVSVNYVLKLADGTLIQDSKQVGGGAPFRFIMGAGQLIPGWEMGIQGMHVGGKRLITIPPELGYGNQPAGPIPPNSTLVFEIEVTAAEPFPQQNTVTPTQ